MDVLISLAPIALIVVACAGIHFFMMRGMHGGGAHDMHADQPATKAYAKRTPIETAEERYARGDISGDQLDQSGKIWTRRPRTSFQGRLRI
jgi:uncharacterized membrane protein